MISLLWNGVFVAESECECVGKGGVCVCVCVWCSGSIGVRCAVRTFDSHEWSSLSCWSFFRPLSIGRYINIYRILFRLQWNSLLLLVVVVGRK